VSVVGDFEHTTYVLGVECVVRRCIECGQYKPAKHFWMPGPKPKSARLPHVCGLCRKSSDGRSRGLVITKAGHELLEQWRREEAKQKGAA
jgi:hypothetical protein